MTEHTANKLTKENRRQIVHFFILGIWALIQYSLGNKPYGLFIIAFFFILVKFRLPNFTLVAIPVLVIVLFSTTIIDTGAQLKQWNLNTAQNYKRTLIDIFTPNAGQNVLPITVRRMLSLLQDNNITSYRLLDHLYQDPLIMQRIVESAWPIKLDNASPYILRSLDEINNDSRCIEIDHRKEVALDYCH